MWKEAGVLLSPLVDMIKIHQSDSCLKVQVTRPWLDKWSSAQTSILFRVPKCTCQSPGSIYFHIFRDMGEEF